MWCGVWREGREGKGKGRERRGEERESISIHLSLSISSPSTPLRGRPPVGPPWDTTPSQHTPLHTLPSQHRPKNGGSPPPPHQGKGRKKRGKRALYNRIIPNFSLWGRTPRPPPSTGTRKRKDKKDEGARYVDGPDKIDRSRRDEFSGGVRFLVARLPAEIERPKVSNFGWGVASLGVG